MSVLEGVLMETVVVPNSSMVSCLMAWISEWAMGSMVLTIGGMSGGIADVNLQ